MITKAVGASCLSSWGTGWEHIVVVAVVVVVVVDFIIFLERWGQSERWGGAEKERILSRLHA